LAAEETAGTNLSALGLALLEFLDLVLRVLERKVLDQHRLGHKIQRVRAIADPGTNEVFCFCVFRRRRRLGNLVRQFG
jgi:hypothetical protein